MSLLVSGLAGNDSLKEEASLTWTGGHTTEKGEWEESERPKEAQLLALKGAKA